MTVASEWSGWLKIGLESWPCSSEEEHFLNVCRILSLIPSTTKKERKKERGKKKKRKMWDLKLKLNKRGYIDKEAG